MQVTLKLTDHSWTQEKQYEKFEEELLEFYIERKKWYHGNCEPEKLVQEGIDVAKSYTKFLGRNHTYNFNSEKIYSSANLSDRDNDLRQALKNRKLEKGENNTIVVEMLIFLMHFCHEFDLNIIDELKKNDEKNEKKGVKEKVYLENGDKEMFDNLTYFESLPDEYIERLKSLINRIEE